MLDLIKNSLEDLYGHVLIEQKATPECYPACIHFFLAQIPRPETGGVKVEAQVEGHPEAHPTVDPALAFAATTRLTHRQQSQRLYGA